LEHDVTIPDRWATKRPEELQPAEFITLTADLFGTVDVAATAAAVSEAATPKNTYVWRKMIDPSKKDKVKR
jgi:hypothetical protein